MLSLKTLQKRFQDLESQIEAVKQEGEFLTGVRLERSPAGGTASQEAKETSKYAWLLRRALYSEHFLLASP